MFNNKNKKGFTLIELLVVIAIISLLSSVIFASLRSARDKSRDARRVADIKQIQLALELYFDSNRNYPTGLYGTGATDGLTNGGYIPKVSFDPSGTSIQYSYAYCTANRRYYHLGSSLELQSNPGLLSDRDCNSGIVGSCTSAGDCSAAYTGAFNGGSGSPDGVQKCNASHTGNYCYDVVL